MEFSVGILYSAQEILRFIKGNPRVLSGFSEIFDSLDTVASPKIVFEVCQRCEWVQIDVDGYVNLTDKADSIVADYPSEIILRTQLHHLIDAYKPTWIPLLTRGRNESIKYLPQDIVQCLREADLLNTYSDEVVLWWDKVGKISRRTDKDEKMDVGRRGEKMSLAYETKRTGRQPKWQGFESNFSGYDILSVVNTDKSDYLNIEVKTSNSVLDVASFFVSRNEWGVAVKSSNYLFHLWALVPKPTLFIISVDNIKTHVPSNNGDGDWVSVEIPFTSVVEKNQGLIFNSY